MEDTLSKALNVLTEKIERWFIDFAASLPNLLVAALVFALFWYGGQLVKISSHV